MDRRTISRRKALAALAAPAILPWRRARAGEPVRVGLIMTTSGPFASSGDMMNKAADLFMASKAPAILGGQTLELIKRDDGGPNPEAAKRLVQELVVRNHVQYLGGLQWSPNANAIAPLLTQAKIPCVIMNASTAQTVRLSPYFTRTSDTIWQSAYPMGQWAARNQLRNVYTLVTDFTDGIGAEQGFTKGLTDGGGTVVASVRMPIQSPDFVPFLQRARDTRPDAVFAFHPGGSQAAPFLRAAAEVQLPQAGIKLIGTGYITSDEELPGTRTTAVGVITTHHYSAAADRPALERRVRHHPGGEGPMEGVQSQLTNHPHAHRHRPGIPVARLCQRAVSAFGRPVRDARPDGVHQSGTGDLRYGRRSSASRNSASPGRSCWSRPRWPWPPHRCCWSGCCLRGCTIVASWTRCCSASG